MKQSLSIRLGQNLALTPQLQQSIKLLQLSTLELNSELEQFIADNPLLEREDGFDALAKTVAMPFDGATATPSAAPDAPAAERAEPTLDTGSTGESGDSWSTADDGFSGGGLDGDSAMYARASDGANAQDGDDRDGMSALDRYGQEISATLREHLLNQLALMRFSQRDRALVTFLIDLLDDDGFLSDSEAELLDLLPAELEIDVSELRAAMNYLRGFDPTGVGARDCGEAVALQLRKLPMKTPHLLLAVSIATYDLHGLAGREQSAIKKKYGCTDTELRAAHALIRTANPKPGAAFGGEATHYVIPDVIVKKIRGTWQVKLNQEAVPRVRINQAYANALKRARLTARAEAREDAKIAKAAQIAQIASGNAVETPASQGSSGNDAASSAPEADMQTQLQEARWLIKNIAQRFDTIERVAQAIVERQRHFFDHGEVAMRPLVLREIADTLGLHESTISRVTTQKYMITPRGLYELKYFFGSHVATDSGGAASSTAIRALIRQIVGGEDARTPLSDSTIAELLGKQGIVVARRTIAKYRESLSIGSVNARKVV